MQTQLRNSHEQHLLEEQAILDEYQQHCYEEVGTHYDSQVKDLLSDEHTDARGLQRGGAEDDGELTELNHQLKETELGNEGIRERGGGAVVATQYQGRRQSEDSQFVSVDLSALELEKEEAARSKKQMITDVGLKRAKMHSHKSIVKGAPPSKRMIHYNASNEEMLRKNRFNSNRVRMTKYTLLSWAPLSLFNQFKRISNIYFLVISILTFMPFSPKDPASMIGTFAMVLFFTMLKDAYEDIKRYNQQTEVNRKKSRILKSQLRPSYNSPEDFFRQVFWEQMQAGQIVMVRKNEDIPADILLLYSANENGIAYVDTMALDGETNLKEKVASIDDNVHEIGFGQSIQQLAGTLICDQPNENLENWEGVLNQSKSSKIIPCSVKNLLIRGSVLRNTDWAVGLAVYTGIDTKIFRNSKAPPHKISNVMKQMNRMLVQIFILQLTIVFISTGLNYYWSYFNLLKHPESGATQQDWDDLEKNIVKQVFSFWVAFSHMIPISLYVAIEALKLTQGMLVGQDIKMYDGIETKAYANCKNSDLTEELGQVQMIFSDKTGTLTMNKMEFKKCTIAGVKYCEPTDSVEKGTPGMCPSGIDQIRRALIQESVEYYQSEQGTPKPMPVLDFFKALALCHTVVCDADYEYTDENPIPTYQASSPDELALVQGASSVGIIFKSRAHSILTLQNMNTVPFQQETFRVLAEFPFDSTRKCMSVLLQDEYSQRFFLYTKGADNVMLDKITFVAGSSLKTQIVGDLYSYSCQGFRTLVIGMKEISAADYAKFEKLHTSLQSSTSEYKERQLTQLYQKMEQNILYLGSTAIEDKLQDGVPETIANILAAEIRFWVLTGDKLETAIEIAKSCQIIQSDTLTVVLGVQEGEPLTPQAMRQVFVQKAKEIKAFIEKEPSGGFRKSKTQKTPRAKPTKRGKITSLSDYKQENVVLVVEGSTLSVIFGTKDLEERFFQMGLQAKSVICCRVSPKQKADVVALYKKKGDWITLSIGDGANDVSMILEANIGVGIRGKEGTQAIRSADYSISQFRFLLRLLLIHGRLGYIRVSKMIFSYFYKNIVLVFTEIPFEFFSGYSGQLFFLDWLPTLYNAVFTSWQVLFAFMYERDINEDYTFKFPLVYKIGQEGRLFTKSHFWSQILLASYQGLLCFFLPLYGLGGAFPEGRTYEHWYYSTISYALILHLVTYKLFVDSSYWTVFSLLSGFLGIALFYLFAFLCAIPSIADIFHPQLASLMTMLAQDCRYYYLQALVPIMCMIPNLSVNFVRQIFYPEIEHTIMHMQAVLGDSPKELKGKPAGLAKRTTNSSGQDPRLKSAMKVRGSEASPRAVLSPMETEEEEELEGKKQVMVGSPRESNQSGLYYSRRWGFVSNARVNPDEETDAGSSPKKHQRDSISQSPFKERSFVVRPFDNDESVFNRMDSSKQMMLNHESSTIIKLFSTPKKREDECTDEDQEDLAKYSAKKQKSHRHFEKSNPISLSQNQLSQGPLFGFGHSNPLQSSAHQISNLTAQVVKGRNFGRMIKSQVHPANGSQELARDSKVVFESVLSNIDPNQIAQAFQYKSSPQHSPSARQSGPLLDPILAASPSNQSAASQIMAAGPGPFVPSTVALSGRVNAERLLEEGHPLQRSSAGRKEGEARRGHRGKKRKYLDKYRDIAAIERAKIEDDTGLYGPGSEV